MTLNRLILSAFFLPSCFAGCSEDPAQSPQKRTAPSVSKEESAAISALKTAGVVIKTDDAGSATEADFRKATLSPDLLAKLVDLKSLKTLNFADTSLDDDSLSSLRNVGSSLVSLDVRGCKLSDRAAATIGQFTALRALRFSGKNGNTTIGDDGLKSLSGCKSLKVLALDNLWVGIAGIESIAGLTELEELYLADTVVDDDSVKLIAQFPKLKKLRLARTQVGDAALAALSKRTSLEELDLSEDALITNAGIAHLAKLSALKKLNLWRVQISNEGALMLAPLTKLEWLNLDNTKLSDDGLATLKEMKALTFLHLGSTQITEAGAPALFHLTTLKDLKITRTALAASETAVADLKKNLPNTSIQTEYIEGQ